MSQMYMIFLKKQNIGHQNKKASCGRILTSTAGGLLCSMTCFLFIGINVRHIRFEIIDA